MRQNWDQIFIDIQERKIPEDKVPRLLFECILDMIECQNEQAEIRKEIQLFQTRVDVLFS